MAVRIDLLLDGGGGGTDCRSRRIEGDVEVGGEKKSEFGERFGSIVACATDVR